MPPSRGGGRLRGMEGIGNAERLRRYWTTGEGGLKIRWGTPGDWTRCVRYLSEYMPGRAEGYCNLLHQRATGIYPGHHGGDNSRGPG